MVKKKKSSVCAISAKDHCSDEGMERHGTPEHPIHMGETRYLEGQYVAWEYSYAGKEIGAADFCHHMLIGKKRDNRFVDRLVFCTPARRHHVFYFDVTDIFRKQMDSLGDESVAPTAE